MALVPLARRPELMTLSDPYTCCGVVVADDRLGRIWELIGGRSDDVRRHVCDSTWSVMEKQRRRKMQEDIRRCHPTIHRPTGWRA